MPDQTRAPFPSHDRVGPYLVGQQPPLYGLFQSFGPKMPPQDTSHLLRAVTHQGQEYTSHLQHAFAMIIGVPDEESSLQHGVWKPNKL